jgi:arabinogalactan endo-1,4-beta-galactosidase
MVKITQEVKDGGGAGVFYWEPAWISSGMKDLWGTGSSWENNAFFDFDGNTIEGIDFMKYQYN